MPYAAPRPCTHPGCPRLTHNGKCDAHRKQAYREQNQRRHADPAKDDRLYSLAAWKRLRAAFLRAHPLCVECGAIGTIVDHVRPVRDGGAVYDPDNLQTLCVRDHNAKTMREINARRGAEAVEQ